MCVCGWGGGGGGTQVMLLLKFKHHIYLELCTIFVKANLSKCLGVCI